MPVVQITYDVPLDIAKGLATGELSMLGTAAVRNSNHIAAHIREVSRTISDGDDVSSAAIAKTFKNPKFVIIGLGVVAVAGGVAAWTMSRKQQVAHADVPPNSVANYNASLARYLDAISSGSLDDDLIGQLISDLDALQDDLDSGTISLELSVGEAEKLMRIMADYTSTLANANSVELSGLDVADSEFTEGVVVDMRRYLVAQREIFDRTA